MYQPPEPETMQEGAEMLHEWLQSLERAGFSRHEALHIVTGQPCCMREET